MSMATITLPPTRSSPGDARRWAADVLGEDVLDEFGEALLCISELVTNAVLHGETACDLTLRWEPGRLRIEVRDYAPTKLPVQRDFDRTATTGRGLQMLDRMTTRWGLDTDAQSKTVWCELQAPTTMDRPW